VVKCSVDWYFTAYLCGNTRSLTGRIIHFSLAAAKELVCFHQCPQAGGLSRRASLEKSDAASGSSSAAAWFNAPVLTQTTSKYFSSLFQRKLIHILRNVSRKRQLILGYFPSWTKRWRLIGLSMLSATEPVVWVLWNLMWNLCHWKPSRTRVFLPSTMINNSLVQV
jgi:hypothetical protein